MNYCLVVFVLAIPALLGLLRHFFLLLLVPCLLVDDEFRLAPNKQPASRTNFFIHVPVPLLPFSQIMLSHH
jgi:hypothetical protein